MKLEELSPHLIGIDTEYHTDKQGFIERVFCVAATTADGRSWCKWTGNGEQVTLAEIAAYFAIDEPIFVAHSYELAERKALRFLGEDPDRYDWLCTFHMERLVQNAFAAPHKRPELSLAACLKRRLGIEIDTEHKQAMRQLCIDNATDGHEAQIMAYCVEDTMHLPHLCLVQAEVYREALNSSYKIGKLCDGSAVGLLLHQMAGIKALAKISDYGFPVCEADLAAVRLGARTKMDRLRTEFGKRYAGTYTRISKPKRHKGKAAEVLNEIAKLMESIKKEPWVIDLGDWHLSTGGVQAHLAALIEQCHIENYPRTPRGALKTDRKTLQEYFDRQDNFGADYLWLNTVLSQLKGIAGTGAKDWCATLKDGRLQYGSLNAFGSKTGRCQPKGSRGFVLSWTKFLYGILRPPVGKWLVELDFSAEETAIQAALTKDPAYLEVYHSKDTYCWFLVRLGIIPKAEYETMSKKELKAKYSELRTKMKVFVLAQGYGAGAGKLSRLLGITQAQAAALKTRIDEQLFSVSTRWKHEIIDLALSGHMRGLALPDGWLCRSKQSSKDVGPASATSIQNFPFQSYGGYILRELAMQLVQMESITPIATMHDAVMFMVDEGDMASINAVRSMMAATADRCLGVDGLVQVGEPEIITADVSWTPEHEFDGEFAEIVQLGRQELSGAPMELGELCDEPDVDFFNDDA